jgi:hypothetical protein
VWNVTITFRKEHRLRVFENRMLSGIFESKKDEVTGGWRKLHAMRNSIIFNVRQILLG